MENAIQQEILLMANSSISRKSFSKKKRSQSRQTFSQREELAEACWNGMLGEFLPGLLLSIKGRPLYIWQIQCAQNFLHIDLCERPKFSNREESIDPYIFLQYLGYN